MAFSQRCMALIHRRLHWQPLQQSMSSSPACTLRIRLNSLQSPCPPLHPPPRTLQDSGQLSYMKPCTRRQTCVNGLDFKARKAERRWRTRQPVRGWTAPDMQAMPKRYHAEMGAPGSSRTPQQQPTCRSGCLQVEGGSRLKLCRQAMHHPQQNGLPPRQGADLGCQGTSTHPCRGTGLAACAAAPQTSRRTPSSAPPPAELISGLSSRACVRRAVGNVAFRR